MGAEGEFTALQSSPQWHHKILQLFIEPQTASEKGLLVVNLRRWSSLQSYRLLCLQTFFCFLVNPVVIGAAQRESIALQRAPKASRDSKPMRVFQELYC
jgi:hypothetical protein